MNSKDISPSSLKPKTGRSLDHVPALELENNSQAPDIAQEERAESTAEEMQAAPQLAARCTSLISVSQGPRPSTLFAEEDIKRAGARKDQSLVEKAWFALVKSSRLSSEACLAKIDLIQNVPIKLKLLLEVAKGSIITEPKLRLEAAHQMQTIVNFIEQLETTDRPTLVCYIAQKNAAYYTVAIEPSLEEGELILRAIDGIGDYDLKKQAFRHYLARKNLDESLKQASLLAIVKAKEKEGYYRYWAAKALTDRIIRDDARMMLAVTLSANVSEDIILKAAKGIQNSDKKDEALGAIALNTDLSSWCSLKALKRIQNLPKKEALLVSISTNEKFDPKYRLDTAKRIQNEATREETLLKLIDIDSPIQSADLQFKLKACEAISQFSKYTNLRKEILKKFFTQDLICDGSQEEYISVKCKYVLFFLENSLKKSYADADAEEQGILLSGFVRYLGPFYRNTLPGIIKKLIQELYQATTHKDSKRDFGYAILKCASIQNPKHTLELYTYTLELLLPAKTVTNEDIQDLTDRVLSTEGCSEALCTALMRYCKGLMPIAPSMREAMVYGIIYNVHLDKDFRKKLVGILSIDETEKAKLISAIETGQDIRRFKRMKVAPNEDPT